MKMTRSQVLDHYLGTIKDAFNAGVIPRCHLEDITRADFYGFVQAHDRPNGYRAE